VATVLVRAATPLGSFLRPVRRRAAVPVLAPGACRAAPFELWKAKWPVGWFFFNNFFLREKGSILLIK